MATTLNAESFADINLREHTTLNEGAAAAATTMLVASTDGFAAGQPLFVGTPARDGCEGAIVDSVTDETHLTLTAGLKLPHSKYEPVIGAIGGSIRIYRASVTFDANLNPIVPSDDDFAVLVTRSIDADQETTYYTDPDGGSNYWYKLTYYDSTNNAETALADAVAVRGSDFGHYASLTEIRREAGLLKAYNLSDTVVDQQRAAAESEINSTLAASYTTPFDPVPADVRTLTIQLAAGFLLFHEYGQGSTLGKEKVKDARDRLKAMASRESTITDASGNSLTSSDSISSYPNSSPEEGGPPRAFTADMRF